MKNSIYKTHQGEQTMMQLYEKQVEKLGVEYEELYADTRFGKTHVLKTGNPDGKPVMLFHGGNSTGAFSLMQNLHLIKDYLVYAPDTIGHPGKSDQRVLSSNNLDYGEWASDVIDFLGFENIICMGESFGGGVVAKLMCVSPKKIAKAVLLVPAGIYNASKSRLIISMGAPMVMYLITRKERWFEKAFLPMVTKDETVDKDTLEMIRTTFHHVKVNPNMPSNINNEEVKSLTAPALILAGEKDVLFPGEKVIKRGKELIPHAETYLLKGSGHLYFSSGARKEEIHRIINDFLED